MHTNSKAAETAKSLNAKAFTTGKDVVFGVGQYSPGTSSGKRLLAHELTHAVQQGNIQLQSRINNVKHNNTNNLPTNRINQQITTKALYIQRGRMDLCGKPPKEVTYTIYPYGLRRDYRVISRKAKIIFHNSRQAEKVPPFIFNFSRLHQVP